MTNTDQAAALGTWFAFLGNAFLAPNQESLVASARLLPALSLAPSGADLREALLEALSEAQERVEQEHIRLFLSPTGAPCSPWQSAHGADEQLMGPAHHSVLAWYRAEGIEPKRDNEPADHIGLLLVFWAHLLENGTDDERRARYWREHLAWTPLLCALIRRHARNSFHYLLADVTESLVHQTAPAGTTRSYEGEPC